MRVAFADSFYFLAATNRRDAAHARSVGFVRSNRLAVVTTAWVLTEVADAFAAGRHRSTVSEILKALMEDPAAELIPATDELFQKGFNCTIPGPTKSGR